MIWGTVPQWFSALTAALALWVAWNASRAWQRTLIARRGDDLFVAAHDVAASFYKLSAAVGRKVTRNSFGRHVDEAYVDFIAVSLGDLDFFDLPPPGFSYRRRRRGQGTGSNPAEPPG